MKQNFSKPQIINLVRKNKDLYNKYGVKKIGLFGSYVRGDNKPNSDIDILVEFDSVTFDNYYNLQQTLENNFHKKIDLVNIKALKERIKPYILSEVEWII